MLNVLLLKNHFHIHDLFQTHTRTHSQSFDDGFKSKKTEAGKISQKAITSLLGKEFDVLEVGRG